MKKFFFSVLSILLIGGIFAGFYFNSDVAADIKDQLFSGDEPDLPDFAKYKVDKEDFMRRRAEQIGMYRGVHEGVEINPQDRISAIEQMKQQEDELARTAPQAAWTEIGPNPIPNAQVGTPPSTPASGRVLSIAVHPANPEIVYVGTAQGGLYRSVNGGASWTPLLDGALSLAVNTVAISPSNPETIFVGTGESGFCGDCFFGAGIYRIDNASTTADLVGPFGATTTFAGRSIGKIVVHPTDTNIIFATSSSGGGGIGGQPNSVLAARGVFRSTDALSPAPTFTKLTVSGLAGQDRPFTDMVIDPGNPNLVLVTEVDSFNLAEGGVYRSVDALSPNPTFVRTFATTGVGSNASRTELALHRSSSGVVTVYAASAEGAGSVQRSVDGGATWTQTIDNNFCNPQCFYDIAIDVDPTNADNVYLGGSPALAFGRSTNGGTTFTGNGANFTAGLHVDSHAIAVAPSNPQIVYFGSDGGIYKTNNVSATPIVWNSLNNSTFRATQFMSLAVHSTDPNFSIGGTQDNGTNWYRPDGTWFRVDSGAGGFALIDQTDTSTTVVDVFHTYFNNASLMGYGHSLDADGPFSFRGCQAAGATTNGITCSGAVLFYAPLEQGPAVTGSLGNTLYFGSQILYRSINRGVNHTAVSQQLPNAISAIGISPQNDDVRIVGTNVGGIFGTTIAGATTLDNLDPNNIVPNNYVGRAVVDPQNANTAYVTLAAFGVTNVWKTTTLNNLAENRVAPNWAAANNGLPPVPVSAFIVDPNDSNRLYAGTDIGVFYSLDGGANWLPFGTGLPRVAVFDIAMTAGTPATRQVRIATHGRGLWQIPAIAPTAAPVSVSGRVTRMNGAGVSNAFITLSDAQGNTRRVGTNPFGYYRFADVAVGGTYVVKATHKTYRFMPQVININGEITDLNFIVK